MLMDTVTCSGNYPTVDIAQLYFALCSQKNINLVSRLQEQKRTLRVDDLLPHTSRCFMNSTLHFALKYFRMTRIQVRICMLSSC